MQSQDEARAWWKEAVIYQIYPRSFADSNGDGIGDLNGITAHLPYLAKLGIDVIWLSPVYASPNDDNGYDISDYQAIMDEFGTMEDFDYLLTAAHRLGIKIVMDLVVNHTSDEHAWFVESRSSATNDKRDWYIWRDPVDGREPNDWQSVFSGPAWELDEATGQYYLHCFSRKQPDLNWDNPAVRDAVFDMMTWWCEKGIDGFRMDVISMISKDPSFANGPLGTRVCNGPHVHEYLQEMHTRVLSRFDLLTVGETGGVTIDEAKRYANADGSELNMVFEFDHVDGYATTTGNLYDKWGYAKPQLPAVRGIFNRWQLGLEGVAWNSLYWDNHDQPRVVSRFGDARPEWRVLSAKMLATCLHMMKGTPYIYQGEELGMTNKHFSGPEELVDVEEVNAWHELVEEKGILSAEELLLCFDAVARDNARTPMQWDASPNAGFCTEDVEPWLAVNENYHQINAAACLADPDSVFYYYQELIELRHRNPIVVYGSFHPLLEDSDSIWAYERHLGDRVLTVACNWTDRKQRCDLWDEHPGTQLIGNYATHEDGILLPYEAYVTVR
ncbi:MAG: alpha-glucosidase [Atopobiaceae bacterium]|nr:alpha-glucosidase [Atopobiaceae bacterium]